MSRYYEIEPLVVRSLIDANESEILTDSIRIQKSQRSVASNVKLSSHASQYFDICSSIWKWRRQFFVICLNVDLH